MLGAPTSGASRTLPDVGVTIPSEFAKSCAPRRGRRRQQCRTDARSCRRAAVRLHSLSRTADQQCRTLRAVEHSRLRPRSWWNAQPESHRRTSAASESQAAGKVPRGRSDAAPGPRPGPVAVNSSTCAGNLHVPTARAGEPTHPVPDGLRTRRQPLDPQDPVVLAQHTEVGCDRLDGAPGAGHVPDPLDQTLGSCERRPLRMPLPGWRRRSHRRTRRGTGRPGCRSSSGSRPGRPAPHRGSR